MTDLATIALPYVAVALTVAIILLLTWLAAWLVGHLIARLMRQSAPQVTTAASRVGVVAVWLVGGIIAVQQIGVSPDVLLVVLLLLGGAAVVALRRPLENFGAKFFADVYVPFKVGDSLRVREYSGRVIEINAMSTVLLSDDDRLVSIPNAQFLNDVVVNTSPQAWKEVTIPITISNQVDLAAFESELLKSLSKLRLRLDRRFPPVLATKARSAQSTDLVLTLMLRRPEERDAITAEVNQRLADVLAESRAARSGARGRLLRSEPSPRPPP